MSTPEVISGHYVRVAPEDEESVARTLSVAWQDPEIPRRQYELCTKLELEHLKAGKWIAPFAALRNIFGQMRGVSNESRLLDVGASSGYYSEVLKAIGYRGSYTGLDASPYFVDFARSLYPDIDFRLGSATELILESEPFDIILHGACLMHLKEYERAIFEAAGIAKRYVIFHRTPIYTDGRPRELWLKPAYGVPCYEWKFNEAELLALFAKYGLHMKASADVFMDGSFGHRSYLLSVA